MITETATQPRLLPGRYYSLTVDGKLVNNGTYTGPPNDGSVDDGMHRFVYTTIPDLRADGGLIAHLYVLTDSEIKDVRADHTIEISGAPLREETCSIGKLVKRCPVVAPRFVVKERKKNMFQEPHKPSKNNGVPQ